MPDVLSVDLSYTHRADVPPDDGEAVTFLWHWPRGTFERRMSARELAAFLLPQLPFVLPLLSDHPRVYAEFRALLVRLASWPAAALDEVVRWCKPRIQEGPDDLIELNLRGAPAPPGPRHFLRGGRA